MGTEQNFSAAVIDVTPQMATQILEEQEALAADSVYKQRRLDKGRIGQYAREMRTGNWRLNGEAIQFNGARLLNGQHRLHAVVQSNVVVPMLIVRGVDGDAFRTIDQGKVRNINDIIDTMGLSYRREVSSGAKVALCYERCGVPRPLPKDRPTTRETLDYLLQNEQDLLTAAALAVSCNVSHRAGLTALFFLGRKRHELHQFALDLRDGVNLQKDQPVRLLRDRLLLNMASTAKLHIEVSFALSIKAWNATLRKQPLGRLRYSASEDYPEMVR